MNEPDWPLIASSVLDNQKQMLDRLGRIAESEVHEVISKQREAIIEQQSEVVLATHNLTAHLDEARQELHKAVKELTGSIMGIVQVPIAVAVIGVASWGFFMKYIDQWLWIGLIAVASFRYLGDSITAVVSLFGLRKNGGK